MKKNLKGLLACLAALTLLFSCLAGSALADEYNILIGENGQSYWHEFKPEDLDRVAELIKKEYNRTSRLRSEKDKGKSYFNYGRSTDEGIHAWCGSEVEYNGVPHAPVGCMAQDFVGGNSTCYQAFAMPENWCCIVVTKKGFDKGEAYTIRDAVASQYAAAGGTNSYWGLPTSNQYWVVEDGQEVLYQQFDNGYARAVDGSSLSAFFGFHYFWDEETDMNFPKSGSAERPSYMLPDGTKGDVDGNNAINVSDIMTLKGLIMDGSWTDEQLAAGDMNDDKTLNVSDILSIKTLIMNGI